MYVTYLKREKRSKMVADHLFLKLISWEEVG